MYICENCGKEFESDWRKKKSIKKLNTCSELCAKSLAGTLSFKDKTHSIETKKKIGKSINMGGKIPENIFDISLRTQKKIIDRMGIGCSYCGWNESSCDIHHIIEKKNGGSNDHSNLSYICPNCHRKVHNKLIDPKELKPFDLYLKETNKNWKDYFYG